MNGRLGAARALNKEILEGDILPNVSNKSDSIKKVYDKMDIKKNEKST